MAQRPDDIDDSSAPLIEHLAELRTRLIWSVLAFVLAAILCYFVWQPVFNFLTHPICGALAKRGQDVTDEELRNAEARIRADYPGDTFQKMLADEYIDRDPRPVMNPCAKAGWSTPNPAAVPTYMAMASGPCASRIRRTLAPISPSAWSHPIRLQRSPSRFSGASRRSGEA